MRRLFQLSFLFIVAGCNSSSSPTAPPAPPAVATSWSGSRAVVGLSEGAGTCLGDLISSRAPTPVQVTLPPSPNGANTIGNVAATSPYWDGCSTVVDQVGNRVTWSNFQCSASCWLEEFHCGGGNSTWTYCRSWGDFSGTIASQRLTGTQIETFEAIRGSNRYTVRAEYRYEMEQN
jgi:hypothetical protein